MFSISILSNLLSLEEKDFEKDVKEIVENNGFHIYVTLSQKLKACPECGAKLYIKEYKNRIVKHSFLYKKTTYIHIKYRRYFCSNCNAQYSEKISGFPTKSRISIKLIIDVLHLLTEWTSTNISVAKQLSISATTVQNIFDKYVNPPRKKLPKIICLDEAYEKGMFNKPYMVVFFDFLGSKIIDVIEDRSKHNLSKYFARISREERANVEVISIDMWEPYAEIASTFFPQAAVVVDSFHVMQNIFRALDKVRCRIMSEYEDDRTIEYYLLKNYHDLLITYPDPSEQREYNHRFKRYLNRYEIRQMLFEISDELKLASNFYSIYQHFNSRTNLENLSEDFDLIVQDPMFLRVHELVPVIQMLQNWKDYIIRSFKFVEDRRISNGPIEGMNSHLKKLMRTANGWLNFPRFRARLMLCFNKEFTLNPVKIRIPKINRGKRGKYKKKTAN